MAPDAARNSIELYCETKDKIRRLHAPSDLDILVLGIMQDLVDSGRYADDPCDERLLADARRYLCSVGRTLTCHEIDQALVKWSRLNASLVTTER